MHEVFQEPRECQLFGTFEYKGFLAAADTPSIVWYDDSEPQLESFDALKHAVHVFSPANLRTLDA